MKVAVGSARTHVRLAKINELKYRVVAVQFTYVTAMRYDLTFVGAVTPYNIFISINV